MLSGPRIVGDGENEIKINDGIFLERTLDDYTSSIDADVSEKLAHDLIIGASLIQERGWTQKRRK